MATQKCPKCGSSNVRRGYRPTHLLLKAVFRYHLLCDDCNWEFSGFAIPGTVPKKIKKKRNSTEIQGLAESKGTENNEIEPTITTNESSEKQTSLTEGYQNNGKNKVKKRVKVKLH